MNKSDKPLIGLALLLAAVVFVAIVAFAFALAYVVEHHPVAVLVTIVLYIIATIFYYEA